MSGGATVGLPLEVEFAEAPGEAEGDVALGGIGRLGGGIAGGCGAALVEIVVEDIADAEAQRETAVAEGGRGAEAHGEVAFVLAVETDGGGPIADVGVDAHELGHLDPQADVGVPGEALLQRLAFEGEALMVETAVEAQAGPGGGTEGEVGVKTVFERGADVVGHRIVDDASQPGVDAGGGGGDALDAVGGVVGIGFKAGIAYLFEISIPAEGDLVGERGVEGAVADGVGVVAVGARGGEVAARGIGDREAVAEAEVVHRHGTVGEAQGGLDVEETIEGVVGEEAGVVDMEPVLRGEEVEVDGGALPFVPPRGAEVDAVGVTVLYRVAQAVGHGIVA